VVEEVTGIRLRPGVKDQFFHRQHFYYLLRGQLHDSNTRGPS